ncbi:MAG: tRNA guanosine(34) transglycosylase Tgt [Candidatus Nealsonbacteria bacterium]|nr:tRNA guanosine(34) transglycosylase Tgt [Candidatus Nealsonbacteria bacterium]
MEFKILKSSKKSRARLGMLKTAHGLVETPCLVPVATQAAVKALTAEQVRATKSQILICNTFHLHLKPGEKIVKSSGGLHQFMNWQDGSLMTDSGGFQVFSLGFGKEFGTGKILKEKRAAEIKEGQQSKLLKITEEGVFFTSFLDGRKLFLGPRESMKIQGDLGADIVFAFDECTSPLANYQYTRRSLEKTHRWAKICLDEKKSKQALFGIVQGGKFKDLRVKSAKFIGNLPFEGFGIGGEFGDDKSKMSQMLEWTIRELPPKKPRHLLGIGYLEDIPKIIRQGIDTFDCIVPTHYARRGFAFTGEGKLDLGKALYLKDKKPLDRKCDCFVCQSYSRSYICHLLRAKEVTPLSLLTFHNLYFFNSFIEKIRARIRAGKF